MGKVIIGMDEGIKSGDERCVVLIKDDERVSLNSDEAKDLCEDLAHIFGFEIIEKHRLKVFGSKAIEPNAEYIGSLIKEHS